MPLRSVAGSVALLLLSAWALIGSEAVQAHGFTLTEAVLVVRADGRFDLDVTADLDALVLGAPTFADQANVLSEEDSQIEVAALADQIAAATLEERLRLQGRLQRLFETRIRLRVDGEPQRHRATFPERSMTVAETGLAEDGSYFGVTARLSGRVPAAASTMTVTASRAFRVVHLTVLQQNSNGVERQVMQPGEQSRPITLAGGASGASAVADSSSSGHRPVADALGNQRVQTFLDYVSLGTFHILPWGLDHLAFLLALCLVTTKWRVLVIWVSGFTLGHTVSLGLAALGLVAVSPVLVEPLIAVSVGMVAWRALRRSRGATDGDSPEQAGADVRTGPRFEFVVVSALGLLHGFGFAGALFEIGLPQSGWLLGLLGFNAGVELGQLVALAGMVLVLQLVLRVLERRQLVLAIGWVLLGVSIYWTVERVGLLG